jgi:hypothetical protein
MQRKTDHLSFLKNELKENEHPDRSKDIVAVPEYGFSYENVGNDYFKEYTRFIKHKVIVTEYDVANPNYEELFGDKNMLNKVMQNPNKYMKHFLETITKYDKGEISDPLEIFEVYFDKDFSEVGMHCYLHGTTIECDSAYITFKYNKELDKWIFLEDNDFLVLDIKMY